MDFTEKLKARGEDYFLPGYEFEQVVNDLVKIPTGHFHNAAYSASDKSELYDASKVLYAELVELSAAIRSVGQLVDRLADEALSQGLSLHGDFDLQGVELQKEGEGILLDILERWKELGGST